MTAPLALTGPLLLFGGPYSNLEATRAVLAEAERCQISHRSGSSVPATWWPMVLTRKRPLISFGQAVFTWSWATAKRRCPWEQRTAAAALPQAAIVSGSQ